VSAVAELSTPLRVAIEAATGSRVTATRSLRGGDVAAALGVDLHDGRRLFVKTRAGADVHAFEVEASGLRWLAEAGALRIPEVIAVGGPPAFLAIERIEVGTPARDHDARLGRGLAALHRFGAPAFGLDHDNLIGTLPQENRVAPDWPTFYGEARLLAMARRAGLHASLLRRLERVVQRLPELCGPAEPPSRLHGDLWAGNAIVDDQGAPVLVDPAVYGGHREVDLAMMRLFGGFSRRTFDAYAEAWPLAPGWEARVPLYQLYPLLVHVGMFGGGYVAQLERALSSVA
jgi:fructosamine-3-kinase